jgi:pimeloyl-ACP methyl ester carboxylesterase
MSARVARILVAAVLAFLCGTAAAGRTPDGGSALAPGAHTAEVNGLRMYYEVHGAGRPLVLLHGAFGSAEAWGTVLPTLAKTRQLIVVEQQGHGHTPDRDRPLSFEQMADDTGALLEQLGVTDADVFGYSMGGTVALGLAIRHPGLVRRVAILGSTTRPPKESYEPAAYAQLMSLPDDFAPDVFKKPYERVAPDPTRWPVLVQKIKGLARDFAGYTPEAVASINAPVLIMMGDREGIRLEHGVEMFRQLRAAQLAVFPNGDHFLLYTAPDRILATLVPFLEGPTTP